MKKSALLACWIVIGTSMLAFGREKIPENLLSDFTSTDWPAVLQAKENIENLEANGIPQLISLLDDFSIRKLENSGDLIYPGAERFYGHGQIVDYSIDEISIRAGWLLEEIAFQNFGFTGIHLPEDELTGFIQYNFPEYCDNTRNKQGLNKMTVDEKRELIKSLSIKKAQSWWKQQPDNWTRLDALVSALQSADEKRQVKALFYIRNGKTRCSGLTKTFYQTNIENIVRALSKVDLKRVSENAKLIMLDMDYEWLDMKSANPS
jgi:hypothetical protein